MAIETKGNYLRSDDTLPASEQLRYRSKRFGRGYSDGQVTGYRVYAAEVELRYIQPIPTALLKSRIKYFKSNRFYNGMAALQ